MRQHQLVEQKEGMNRMKGNKLPRMYFAFATEGNTHKIYLYDDISERGEFDWKTWEYKESETSATYFQKMLSEIPEEDEIEIFINSNGGSVKEGTAIYNQLKRHKARKTGHVDGVCHSIAFTILQACDYRMMGEGTSALIHEPWTATAGNANELEAEAKRMRALTSASVKLLMQKAKNITEQELRKMMAEETMLTPEDALKYGFVDEIEGRSEEVILGDPMQAANNIRNMRKKFQSKDFDETIKEFETLTKNEEPKSDVSEMDTFFKIFS